MVGGKFDEVKRINGIQSVKVAATILDALCDQTRPSALKNIAHAAGMPPAKAHRYLASLVQVGLAKQDRQNGLYDLGPMATRIGISAISRNDVVTQAGAFLRTICLELEISGHISVWGENGPVLIRCEHGGPPIVSSIGLGTTFPLAGSATGRVFLSFMERSSTKHLMPKGKNKLSESELKSLIAETQAKGFARITERLVPGLAAMAWPVFGIDKNLACSITLVSADPAFFDRNADALLKLSVRIAADCL